MNFKLHSVNTRDGDLKHFYHIQIRYQIHLLILLLGLLFNICKQH